MARADQGLRRLQSAQPPGPASQRGTECRLHRRHTPPVWLKGVAWAHKGRERKPKVQGYEVRNGKMECEMEKSN